MPPVHVGIDLGTSNSCVGIWKPSVVDGKALNGQAEILQNGLNNEKTTPSFVMFTETETRVGQFARRDRWKYPENTIYSIKRIIGRSFSDPFVSIHRNNVPYEIIDKNGEPFCKLKLSKCSSLYSPVEVSTKVLEEMQRIIRSYADHTQEISTAVITVPAYFKEPQRRATKEAAEAAGFPTPKIINEPTAAAIAYCWQNRRENSAIKDENIFVFDLGGGTFDVTIVSLQSEGKVLQVRAHGGNSFLGGDDFDNRIYRHVLQDFSKNSNGNIKVKKREEAMLLESCRQAKEQLSAELSANIYVPYFGGSELVYDMTRSEFEDICKDLFDKIELVMDDVLREGKFYKSDISKVVMVGGSIYISRVKEIVKRYFKNIELCTNINSSEAIAQGAAIYAASFSKKEFEEGAYDGEGYTTLRDVTAHSLGIKAAGDQMVVLIPKFSPIPFTESRLFANSERSKGSFVKLSIYQGENQTASKNTSIGDFRISLQKNLEVGQLRLAVKFELDEGGCLHISASDENMGIKNVFKIEKISN